MTSPDEKGSGLARTPGGESLRVTPMPGGGGEVLIHLPQVVYLDTQVWSLDVGITREALAGLRDAIDAHLRGEAPGSGVVAAWRQEFPIGTHPYEGFGFEAPCTASGYGTACGATEYDHTETT